MSRYAVHTDRRELLAIWGDGIGAVAHNVADNVDPTRACALAGALSRLAAAAWRTYTHPASGASNHGENSEHWRREQERAAFDDVRAALTNPHLPKDGTLIQAYSPVTESAHHVGRVLHDLADPALTSAVVADVAAELAAVDAAERGELAGRARQAVTLTRADASPLQIAAADALLREDPFGTTALFTEVEPSAAAIAAAHWFLAAVEVAADSGDIDDFIEVIRLADDIQPVPIRSLSAFLELTEFEDHPRPAVLALIQEAMLVADGYDPGESGDLQDEDADDEDGDEPKRLCALDPTRPAHDLLEDLLAGINAAWLVFGDHYVDNLAAAGLAPDVDEAADPVDALREAITTSFLDALRHAAEVKRDRLS
jgi:hypothetical protein